MELRQEIDQRAQAPEWQSVSTREGAHYNVFRSARPYDMAQLRDLFEDGEADELNLCLFSTSGVHGTYNTIEKAEKHLSGDGSKGHPDITFLIIHPRLVCLRYGEVRAQTADDIAFLKKLRASSWRVLQEIGRG